MTNMTPHDPDLRVDPVLPVDEDDAAEAGEDRPRRRLPLPPLPPPRQRLSEVLAAIVADTTRERISVADLLAAMPGRATAALLLIFAAPNAVPAPPGMSALLGLPMIYLALQMMLRRQPWLPKVVAARSMLRTDVAAMLDRALPWLQRAERMLRPRLTLLVTPTAEVFIGAFALVLALAVALPIPLGNMLPAFAVCLLALGVLERDGLWVLGGGVVGVAALAVVASVVTAGVKLIGFALAHALT